MQLLLGVLLPIVVAAVTWRAPPREQQRSQGPAAAAAPPAARPALFWRLVAHARRLPAVADAAAVRCNGMLVRLVVPSTQIWGVGLVHSWWLTVLVWWVCKAFCGLPS